MYATKASRPFGSTQNAQILFARLEMASQRSAECAPKDVHSHFHPAASTPEGPAALSILSVVLRIRGHQFNWTGWGSEMLSSGAIEDT